MRVRFDALQKELEAVMQGQQAAGHAVHQAKPVPRIAEGKR
jgi:hypothetical protein